MYLNFDNINFVHTFSKDLQKIEKWKSGKKQSFITQWIWQLKTNRSHIFVYIYLYMLLLFYIAFPSCMYKEI